MDGRRFDELTKTLAGGFTRRRLLRALGAGVSGGLLGWRGVREAAADTTCKPAAPAANSKCTKDAQCCVGLVCEGGRCKGGCHVDGQYYTPGQPDPTTPCKQCQPATSTTAFVPTPGVVPCGPGPSCAGGVATAQATCDGAGGCPPGATVPCAPYLCGATACTTACTSDDGCAGAAYCDTSVTPGVCREDLANGQACLRGAQCLSGFCVDNVCCDAACEGQCEACNVEGSLGTCTALSDTPCDDGDPCTKDDVCTGGSCVGTPYTCVAMQCQESSFCDGLGGCTTTNKGNGTSCEAGDPCTNDTCQNGVCVKGSVKDCSEQDDACNDGICNATTGDCEKRPKADDTPCNVDILCVLPGTCFGGQCDGSGFADGDPCNDGHGTCHQGACCDAGPVAEAQVFCTPTVDGGICCSDGVRCCGNAGCCNDCYGSFKANFTDPIFTCCSESKLCPPRSESNPEPPFCCSGEEICVTTDGPAGCYPQARVCEGKRCPEPCCGGKCCASDERCFNGVCRKDTPPCDADHPCEPGWSCVGIEYVIDDDGNPVPTGPGTCCPGAYVCGDLRTPGAFTSCCAYGDRCCVSDPEVCVDISSSQCPNQCICNPRGGFTRL